MPLARMNGNWRVSIACADDLKEGDEGTLGLLRDVSFKLNQLRDACQYGQSFLKVATDLPPATRAEEHYRIGAAFALLDMDSLARPISSARSSMIRV